MEISGIVDLESYPLFDLEFQRKCRMTLDGEGLLSLTQFIQSDALADMLAESLRLRGQAYFCQQTQSEYLR